MFLPCIDSDIILFHLLHLLVVRSYTLLVSLVKGMVLLSFFVHSSNSNFSRNLFILFIYSILQHVHYL